MFPELQTIYSRDPAARTIEPLFSPGFHAVCVHRYLIHPLYTMRIPVVPYLLSMVMRFLTGIEIHPGAVLKKGVMIDHGMGVVIGETAVVGEGCILHHNVTLGGTGKQRGKRHPTIGDNVFIGTGATILGNLSVGDNVKIGAGTLIINKDIPGDVTVVGSPFRIVQSEDPSILRIQK